jgi:hypothetical protein
MGKIGFTDAKQNKIYLVHCVYSITCINIKSIVNGSRGARTAWPVYGLDYDLHDLGFEIFVFSKNMQTMSEAEPACYPVVTRILTQV